MIGDKTMIQRVWEQVAKAEIGELFVATDDQRIYDHVLSFGGHAIMTHSYHKTGTERCAEAVWQYGEKVDYVLNVQGDQPFINSKDIHEFCFNLEGEIMTMAVESEKKGVSVAIGNHGQALYFSRENISKYKHIGVYAYKPGTLEFIRREKMGYLEERESLEQLRWLAWGINTKVRIVDNESFTIDTKEDLQEANRICNN